MSNITSSRGGHRPSSFVTNFDTITLEGPCLRENRALDKISSKVFSKIKKKDSIRKEVNGETLVRSKRASLIIKSEDTPSRKLIQKEKTRVPTYTLKELKSMMKKINASDLETLKNHGYKVQQLSRKEVLRKPCFKSMFVCNYHVMQITKEGL